MNKALWTRATLCTLPLFASLAHAQQAVLPGFGAQLTNLSWEVWLFVLGFGAVGAIARIVMDGGSGKLGTTVRMRLLCMLRIIVLGEIAAFAVFAVLEFSAEKLNLRMPDLMTCLLFTAAAIFQEDVIEKLRGKVNRVMDK